MASSRVPYILLVLPPFFGLDKENALFTRTHFHVIRMASYCCTLNHRQDEYSSCLCSELSRHTGWGYPHRQCGAFLSMGKALAALESQFNGTAIIIPLRPLWNTFYKSGREKWLLHWKEKKVELFLPSNQKRRLSLPAVSSHAEEWAKAMCSLVYPRLTLL